MCGIAGIYQYLNFKDDLKIIDTMLKNMKHRGPDGLESIRTNNVYLGSVRLAMSDIKSNHVILRNEKNDIFLAYNGEIYNNKELRKHLKPENHSFKTNSDGEILIHLYEEFGEEFLNYVDGMFAFALFDNKNNKLILARDNFGIKPLYYYNSKDKLIFSSEISPILNSIKKQKICKEAISSYLQYRFIAHPLTPFKDIKKVSPGEMLIIKKDKIHKKTFNTNTNDNHNCLYSTLKENVESTLKSDATLGGFLSGGLDSAIVCSFAAKKQKDFHCFTIKYDDRFQINENKYADKVCKKHNIKNHILQEISENDNISNIFNETIKYLEEPIYSTVSISTYLLSKKASKFVKGVLTGDGSDELYMSYPYIKDSFNSNDMLKTYSEKIGWLSEHWKNNLILDKTLFKKINLLNDINKPIETIRNFELLYRLSDYHLFRVDKLSMANSIEARIPFLRNSIYSHSNKQDFYNILKSVDEKELLKQSCSSILPEEIINRKKQPFSAPWISWINNELKEDIIKEFSKKEACCLFEINQQNLTKLIYTENKRYSDYCAIWGIFILFKWYDVFKNHIEK